MENTDGRQITIGRGLERKDLGVRKTEMRGSGEQRLQAPKDGRGFPSSFVNWFYSDLTYAG